MSKHDIEEKGILRSYEKGEWKTTRPSKRTIKQYQTYARGTYIKDRRINIRLSSKDVEELQIRAMEEGVPYQTLMASVLHKFVTGGLKERTSGLTSRSRRTRLKRSVA